MLDTCEDSGRHPECLGLTGHATDHSFAAGTPDVPPRRDAASASPYPMIAPHPVHGPEIP